MGEGEQGAETPLDTTPEPEAAKKPRKPRMVNVYNSHRFRSFHLGQGRKIGPGQSGRIPYALFEKVKDTATWLKRAERGDVI